MTVTMPEVVDRSYSDFLTIGGPLLQECLADLPRAVEEATASGRWHPTGFMVFNLKDITGVGLVRLHYWPQGTRHHLQGHPVIHRHAFHLLSTVVAGNYREIQYAVAPARPGPPEYARAKLHGYQVAPPKGDGFDRLEHDHKQYIVAPKGAVTVYGATESHQMPAGDYHATAIAKSEDCCTLALLSRPLPGVTDHLVGSAHMKQLMNERKMVSEGDRQKFLRYLESNA